MAGVLLGLIAFIGMLAVLAYPPVPALIDELRDHLMDLPALSATLREQLHPGGAEPGAAERLGALDFDPLSLASDTMTQGSESSASCPCSLLSVEPNAARRRFPPAGPRLWQRACEVLDDLSVALAR